MRDALGVETGGCVFCLTGARGVVLVCRESRDAYDRRRGLRAGGLLLTLDLNESLDTEARSLEVRVSPSARGVSAPPMLVLVGFGGCKPETRDAGRGRADGFGSAEGGRGSLDSLLAAGAFCAFSGASFMVLDRRHGSVVFELAVCGRQWLR